MIKCKPQRSKDKAKKLMINKTKLETQIMVFVESAIAEVKWYENGIINPQDLRRTKTGTSPRPTG